MNKLKEFAICAGLYRPARLLHRALHKQERQSFRDGLTFYRQFIEPGNLVFDIGANIGTKTEIFLELGARVVSVEPQPNLVREIKARISHYDRAIVVQAGVSNKCGTATLNLQKETAHASLSSNWGGWPIGGISIQTVTLDDLIEQYGMPQFIKIDIEGHELHALEGLSRPIRYLTLEYNCDDAGVAKIAACIKRLNDARPIKITGTVKDTYDLAMPSWLDGPEFLSAFPGCLARSFYGDLIINSSL